LFAANGLHGCTIRDITDAAGVDVALIKYYFGGKDGLFRDVAEQYVSPLLELQRSTLVGLQREPRLCSPALLARALAEPVVLAASERRPVPRAGVQLLFRFLTEADAVPRSVRSQVWEQEVAFLGALRSVAPSCAASRATKCFRFTLHVVVAAAVAPLPAGKPDATRVQASLLGDVIAYAAAGIERLAASRDEGT
jgi:AcrR family transcriptional regulator